MHINVIIDYSIKSNFNFIFSYMWFHLISMRESDWKRTWMATVWVKLSKVKCLSTIFEPTQVRISDCLYTLNHFEKRFDTIENVFILYQTFKKIVLL